MRMFLTPQSDDITVIFGTMGILVLIYLVYSIALLFKRKKQ